MKRLIFLTLLALIGIYCYSQAASSIYDVRNVYDQKGDFYFEQKNYKKAIAYYNMAFADNKSNYYSVLRKAEAYQKLGLNLHAAECYRMLFQSKMSVPDLEMLKYALLLLEVKDIPGFEQWLSRYNQQVENEIKGGNYLNTSGVRAKMYKDSTVVVVENESFLNTTQAEISPVLSQGKLIFASNRRKLDGSAGSKDYNLYAAQFVSLGNLGKLNVLNRDLNTTSFEGGVAIAPNNNLFFTRGTSSTSGFELFETALPKDSKSKLSPTKVTVQGMASIGQPAFNSDGSKMYFVSEGGGKGGTDIYVCEKEDGSWGPAQNIELINTAKNEMYPWVVDDTLLYFSSDGHNGLGGYDLYVFNLKGQNAPAQNLGSKVNSKYDDYSLSFSPSGITGYFSSNRPGGMGKEDIYRLHLLHLKVKYAAYRPRQRYNMSNDQINLYITDGTDYNISSSDKTGFNFGFQPESGYKMVIQRENVLANDILGNASLSLDLRGRKMLEPTPLNRTEISLETGMRYQFTAGMKPLSNEYQEALNELTEAYSGSSGGSAIDLTALAKELQLEEGEVYTIRFEPDASQASTGKTKEETRIFVNGETVPVSGNSFFIVLPLDVESNFQIKTDIDYFKEAYSPKKVGSVKVDNAPVIKPEPVVESEGFPILVNTDAPAEVAGRKITASELSIVPGSVYILSLSKPNPRGGEPIEVIVPLTKGVKYNLGTEAVDADAFNKAVSQMQSGSSAAPDEELIDISVMSKELDFGADDKMEFTLMPAKQYGAQSTATREVVTTLLVDGRNYYITSQNKMQVNLKLKMDRKINIQTDLAYVKDNFDASTLKLNVDTKSFEETAPAKKDENEIADPVFDVITVNFDLGKYDVRADAKNIINSKVINELKKDKRLYVTIKGYTDALGDAEYNKRLSKNRAEAVRDYLAANGIGANRIRTFSFGESLALDENVNWEDLSEEELQKHRKVEIVMYLPE